MQIEIHPANFFSPLAGIFLRSQEIQKSSTIEKGGDRT
jgi:hypothetical protein